LPVTNEKHCYAERRKTGLKRQKTPSDGTGNPS
jgi:hypothetical protein